MPPAARSASFASGTLGRVVGGCASLSGTQTTSEVCSSARTADTSVTRVEALLISLQSLTWRFSTLSDALWLLRRYVRTRCLIALPRFASDVSSFYLRVKLWSLSAQRVLHTFNHHSDSVWSLFSTHPNLERFYSGDRSGYVASVDMERCTDVSEAECVVICREGGDPDASIPDVNPLATHGSIGINRIVAADDEFLWTATSSSSVSMWRDAGRRTRRIPGFRPASEFEASFDAEVDMEEEEEDEEDEDDDDESSFARAPLLGTTLDQPSSSPNPSISSSFPKRISVDLGRSSLAQTRSRDSHTVAFAPQHAEGSTTSLLKSSARKGRVSSLFGTPTSNHSQPSFELQASTPPPELAPVRPLLHGIPYDSLVNLGTLDSPYGAFGGHTEADIATIYSAASVLSVPDHHRFTDPHRPPPSQTSTAENSARPTPTVPTSHLPSVADHPAPLAVARDALKEAKLDFQERDLIGDAVPLRSTPESFIEGKHGLVRSLMLNDRQHVVTCDTAGGTLHSILPLNPLRVAHLSPPPVTFSSYRCLEHCLLPLHRPYLLPGRH